ncbi:MAG: type II secretion system protein, partial [Woeseiaceae bacterium]|nr:type II secretion system protein [Woeseiaceae bacterium]
MRHWRRQSSNFNHGFGFTLIELLVVV